MPGPVIRLHAYVYSRTFIIELIQIVDDLECNVFFLTYRLIAGNIFVKDFLFVVEL